jgi:Glycosyl hydrolase family 26
MAAYKKIAFRVGYTLAAIAISSMIVYALSHAGNSSRGPIENAITYTGDVVKNIEHDMIVEQRQDKREDKLKWFHAAQDNKKALLHPAHILLGAFDNEAVDNFEPVTDLEDSLRTTFPLMHIYVAWGSKAECRFPAARLRDILDLGSVPVITWEPWLSGFSSDDYPALRDAAQRDKNGMKDVAAGLYDTYITQWARAAKKLNKTILLRPGHEMNDAYRYPWGPQNNDPQDFVAAWRHIHDIFSKEGATKVVWIWSPHPAYDFKQYYPGDGYVDYVGAGVLNYGTVAVWSRWWSFDQIFGSRYPDLSAYGKPIIITEFGSLAVGGSRARWYAAALDSLPQKYPLVRSVLFFHFAKDNTTTQQVLNWYIKDDRPVVNTIVRAIKRW